MDLPSRLEAVLFTAGDPTPVKELAKGLAASAEDIQAAARGLAERYAAAGAGLRVLESPEGLQLVTAAEASRTVEAFITAGMREKLTPAAAETLAIVAYRGPISRAGIEAIRGVNSSFTLRLLALRGLVVRMPHPTDRRMYVYELSADFLRHLGVARLEELPEYQELHQHQGMTKLVADAENAPREGEGEAQGTPRGIPSPKSA